MSSSCLGRNLNGTQQLRASEADSEEQAHFWQRSIERLVADVGPIGAHCHRDRLAVIRMPAQLLRRHLVLAQQTQSLLSTQLEVSRYAFLRRREASA